MTNFRGPTRQALAKLLEDNTTHTTLESLYTRYEVTPPSHQATTNKLRKATYLVEKLAERREGEDLSALVSYMATPAAGMPNALRRGSAESLDFYENFDKDTESVATTATKPASRPAQGSVPRPQRTFKRPGTSAPNAKPEKSPYRRVFVVRGRDEEVYQALSHFLNALDLRVVSWDEASTKAGGGTPHTLDIVRAGIELADAVIVLMTPDDLGHVKGEFYNHERDHPQEAKETGQARQNVVFEAGWAMALGQDQVILVRVGAVRPLSDIDGLNYVWLSNDISSRRQLITRLRNCGLDVHDNHDGWREAGDIPAR